MIIVYRRRATVNSCGERHVAVPRVCRRSLQGSKINYLNLNYITLQYPTVPYSTLTVTRDYSSLTLDRSGSRGARRLRRGLRRRRSSVGHDLLRVQTRGGSVSDERLAQLGRTGVHRGLLELKRDQRSIYSEIKDQIG